MALEIFKRVDTQKGLFAVEKISLLYNLITSLLIVSMFRIMDHPLEMLWDRFLIAVMTFVLMYLYRLAPSRFSAFIRIAVQMSLLAYWYPDTYEFNRLFPNMDHLFAGAEQFIFNGQPALTFSSLFPQMWVSEAVNLGYFAYYPMIFLVAIFYFLFRFELFEKISFVLVTSFFIYYLVYIFIPVAGPQFYFPAIGMENAIIGNFFPIGDYFNHHIDLMPGPGFADGFFYQMVEASQAVGERPTAAFPSSHVGISTILMIMAYRGSKKLFAFLTPFYFLLCCATVYIQAHYLIDSIAGFISGIGLYYVSTAIYKKWFVSSMFAELVPKGEVKTVGIGKQ